jgi:hypothetical protein
LLGVVIGGSLNSWLSRRAEIRRVFLNAMEAVAYLATAQAIGTKTSYTHAAEAHPDRSAALEDRLHNEFIEALFAVRKALAAAVPFSADLEQYLPRWLSLQEPDVQLQVQKSLRAGLRRAMRIW